MKSIQTMFLRALLLLAMLTAASAHAATTTYYHNDLLGSPVVATNSSAQVIWRESYRPYGERLTNSAASTDNDVWFTSRRQDVETGLVYMGARYYDPVLGRFVSKDPVGFVETTIHSFNRYAYANNNPYRFYDPDGANTAPLYIVGGLAIGWLLTPEDKRREMGEALVAGLRGLYNKFKDQDGAPDGTQAETGGDKANETGSYTNTHESGKRYHGKGDRARSQESGREKEQEHGDKHIATDWTRAPDRQQGFVDEAKRIGSDGGVKNPDNYNKINSPGKKYLDE